MTGQPSIELVKNSDQQQYELYLDGHLACLATYLEAGSVIVLPHTETDPAYGGRGLASRLIEFSLADIRSAGRRVDPACPFVAAFIAKHPDYQDLIAR